MKTIALVPPCQWQPDGGALTRVAINPKSQVVRRGKKKVVHTAEMLSYEVGKRWPGETTGGRRTGPVVSDRHPVVSSRAVKGKTREETRTTKYQLVAVRISSFLFPFTAREDRTIQGGDHSLPDRSGAHLWSRRATFFPPRMGAFLPYGPPFSAFFYRAGPPEILG